MNKCTRMLGRIGIILCLIIFQANAFSNAKNYPETTWKHMESPEIHGWSREILKAARDYSLTIDTAAVMIVVNGEILDEWGETTTRFNIHSIRKSFLNALYGIHIKEKTISPDATLAELGINDNEPSLTAIEQTATVRDLLKARSGVYHPALYETEKMSSTRPPRGSHLPNTFWYYNNWDFNALGTIFEQQVKRSLFAEFKIRIAEAIGMEDFLLEDGEYITGSESIHPAYPFRMTARDMARFGLLFLRQGNWHNHQIIPSDWIQESTTAYSIDDTYNAGGYGYLWWVAVNGVHLPGVILPEGSFSARGAGGHYILIVPSWDLVIVHRVNTDISERKVTTEQFGKLVSLILKARIREGLY